MRVVLHVFPKAFALSNITGWLSDVSRENLIQLRKDIDEVLAQNPEFISTKKDPQ